MAFFANVQYYRRRRIENQCGKRFIANTFLVDRISVILKKLFRKIFCLNYNRANSFLQNELALDREIRNGLRVVEYRPQNVEESYCTNFVFYHFLKLQLREMYT